MSKNQTKITRARWTPTDDADLREEYSHGHTLAELASIFDRTPKAIKNRVAALKLKRPRISSKPSKSTQKRLAAGRGGMPDFMSLLMGGLGGSMKTKKPTPPQYLGAPLKVPAKPEKMHANWTEAMGILPDGAPISLVKKGNFVQMVAKVGRKSILLGWFGGPLDRDVQGGGMTSLKISTGK